MNLDAWFLEQRGITTATLDAFKVDRSDCEVLFHYTQGVKTRKFLPDGGRQFYFTKGISPPLYHHEDDGLSEVAFLVEGETDTMRLWQELRGEGNTADVFGLSGVNAWRPELAATLAEAQTVYVILDNDADYNIAERGDEVWKQIRKDVPGAKRIKLPEGVKDLCEFFTGYDIAALRLLAERPRMSSSRYRPLDLGKQPTPPDWLHDGMVARGDVTLFMGDNGLGKSWQTMGLALAVAEGWETFLDLPILHHGRVLYVDEENPSDVVFDRLNKLGLTSKGMGNIRYLWNQGIRLDRKPEEFLEEAMEYEPALIILDSLTRLHTDDENNAGSMAKLYNDGIKPLARETGAAVVLIHHANKSGGTSYIRARGSTDITAGVDAGMDFRPTDPQREGFYHVKQFRSRRRKGGDELIVEIKDTPEGVSLVAGSIPDPPF